MKYGKLIFKEMELKQKSGKQQVVFSKDEWEKFLTETGVGVILVVLIVSVIAFFAGMGLEYLILK
jgi:hypothetical protein